MFKIIISGRIEKAQSKEKQKKFELEKLRIEARIASVKGAFALDGKNICTDIQTGF